MRSPRRILKTSAIAALLFGAAGQAGATPIPITNAGFESPVLTNGAFTLGSIVGWSGAGVFNPTTGQFPGEAPEGQNTGFSNGTSLLQALSSMLAADTTYTLTVLVGDRLDTAFPGYSVQLLAGSTVLSECVTCVTPQNGSFALVTVTYSTGASDPLIGQPLSIALGSAGLQTNFDDVRLDAVPEPTSIPLLASGLGAVAGVGWSRRRQKSIR
jgi:hypothetical protein